MRGHLVDRFARGGIRVLCQVILKRKDRKQGRGGGVVVWRTMWRGETKNTTSLFALKTIACHVSRNTEVGERGVGRSNERERLSL